MLHGVHLFWSTLTQVRASIDFDFDPIGGGWQIFGKWPIKPCVGHRPFFRNKLVVQATHHLAGILEKDGRLRKQGDD